jgi:nuclear pore complex protein Nup214
MIITSVNNCAAQDVVPSSSWLGPAGTVKDFKWLNHASASYIVLSNGGLLCHGSLGEGLKDVMENIDAGPCLFLILFIMHLNLRHIS